ncbi:hypothetical protein OSTOST_25436 [Ostertagia ostertagi]
MYDVLRRVDLLLTPTGTGAAPRFSDHYKGLPAISVPCGSSADNLPIGVQLIGDLLQDRLVCDVA